MKSLKYGMNCTFNDFDGIDMLIHISKILVGLIMRNKKFWYKNTS